MVRLQAVHYVGRDGGKDLPVRFRGGPNSSTGLGRWIFWRVLEGNRRIQEGAGWTCVMRMACGAIFNNPSRQAAGNELSHLCRCVPPLDFSAWAERVEFLQGAQLSRGKIRSCWRSCEPLREGSTRGIAWGRRKGSWQVKRVVADGPDGEGGMF